MNTQEIRVQKGEKIQTAWERLVRWVDTLKVVPGDGIKVRETPNGTIVSVIRDRHVFKHPFKISASEKGALVQAGTVNNTTPYILDVATKSWRRIDNRDDDGKRFKDGSPNPIMGLNLKENEGGKLYISLRVVPNKEGDIESPKKNLRIVQTSTAEGPKNDKDGAAYYPLALFYLDKNGKAIEETFQIVHHNMNYKYQARKSSKGEVTGIRHIFFPV